MLAILAIAIVIAAALSGAFSAAELSIVSLGETRIRTLVDERFRGSVALERLRSRPERMLVLIRLGTALANAAVAALSVAAGFLLGGVIGALLATLLAALIIAVAGDLLPMRWTVSHGVRIALAAAPLLETLTRVFATPLRALGRLGAVHPRGSVEAIVATTERQVREMAALGSTEGVIEEQERQLIDRVFRLDETRVWDIMTPRVDVFAWDESRTLAAIAPEMHSVPYSRIPVYRENIDNITGILYVRDAYQALVGGQRDVRLGELAREPLIVPGSLSLTTLLRDFQTRRIHLAVVVDEYGGTDGLITLEDVLEELVGEIVDETDVAYDPVVRISRNEVIAEGDADLREINHFFNASLPQLEHRSLNGYLLEELGRVPTAGEKLERESIEIEILEASDTQVLRARLRRKAPHEPARLPAARRALPSET
ncbi:MAG: hemolysin family protein, partial [Longimicrobiales bacterium]